MSRLQIFKNSNRAKPTDYEGPREADGIVSKSQQMILSALHIKGTKSHQLCIRVTAHYCRPTGLANFYMAINKFVIAQRTT